VAPLLALLDHPGTWEKPAVLVALGSIGAPEAIPAIVAAAEHPAHWVRTCAIHALGTMRAAEGASVVRRHLDDPAWSVRGASAVALGSVGDASDLGRLLARLDDPHPWARRGAAYALGQLGLAEAAPRLRENLFDGSAEARLAAIWALGRLEDDGACDLLLATLRGEAELQKGEGPGEDEEAMGPLGSDAESRLFDATIQALGRLARGSTDPRVVPALRAVRAALSEEELDRPARLPLPERAGVDPPPSVRTLFEVAVPGGIDGEDD